MEASGSPKDSSGREVHSDWPVWNLQKRGNWSANAPSDPSHQAALEPSNARKRASWGRVRESDGERNAFFFPREELGLSIPGIATGLQTIHTLSCVPLLA